MPLEILPQILIIVGFIGGLTILVRRSHNLSDEEFKILQKQIQYWERFRAFWQREVAEKFPKEELERRAIVVAEKFLRRFRITLARFDSFLSRFQARLQDLRKNQSLDPEYWSQLKTADTPSSPSTAFDPEAEEARLARSGSKNIPDYVNLARLYLAKKNFADARRVLLFAWRFDPQNRQIRTLLSDLKENATKSLPEA